jgi:hypothetical protein
VVDRQRMGAGEGIHVMDSGLGGHAIASVDAAGQAVWWANRPTRSPS